MSPRKAKPKTQAPTAATGQQYGAAGAQLAAQRAVPLPDNTALPAPTQPTAPPVPVVPFGAPTQMPDEPVTAGVPIGPGPGPEALGMPTGGEVVDLLAAAYRAYPSEELRGMLEEVQTRGGDY